MRVLLASPGMQLGGAERLVVDLATGLSERGHEVSIAGPVGPLDSELRGTGIDRVLLPERGRSAAGAAGGAARLVVALRRKRPDVVHAHNVKVTAVAGVAARVAHGSRRPPVVATFHGVAHAEYRSAARLLRAADVVACVSADLADRLRDHGFPPHRVRVVRNAVTAPRTERAPDAGGAPLVVAVGRLVEQKNHERLLEAIALLAPRWPQVRYAIAGDGPLRPRLEARAAELGIAGMVRFAGPLSDARSLMREATLVVFSSDWEGLSLVALEALSEGTPVVTTPVEGMRELAAAGAARVAGAFTGAALADAVGVLLGDPPLREHMAEAGLRLIAREYSHAAMLDAYEALYRAPAAGPA